MALGPAKLWAHDLEISLDFRVGSKLINRNQIGGTLLPIQSIANSTVLRISGAQYTAVWLLIIEFLNLIRRASDMGHGELYDRCKFLIHSYVHDFLRKSGSGAMDARYVKSAIQCAHFSQATGGAPVQGI